MKRSLTLCLLTIATGLTAFAATAQPTPFDMNSMAVELQPRSQKSIAREQVPVHFSFAEKGAVWSEKTTNPVYIASDEYWMQVSGAKLKKGVDLDITMPESLVRFSALSTEVMSGASGERSLSSNRTGDVQRSLPLDPDQLMLFRKDKQLRSAKSRVISEEKLAVSGIFQQTSAMRLKKDIGTGRFTIRSSQNLIDSDQYMVNVKEKGSDKTLNLTAARLSLLNGESFPFKARLQDGKSHIAKARYQAYLKSPSGQRTEVTLEGSARNGWKISLPKNLQTSRPGVLHELYIMANAPAGEARLKRAGKLAFSVAEPAAQLEWFEPVMIDDIAAEATLNIASAGRYELRGTLYGTDKEGQLRSLMRSHSAYWLEPGQHVVPLKLDQTILEDSGLYAPFKLKDIELMDQSQLALIHRQAAAD